jgi:cyclic pyranopterin monophosphate synthase
MEESRQLDENRHVRMSDVSAKPISRRVATAKAFVEMSNEVLDMISAGTIGKGNPLELARVAGIMAAKKTSDLIPLCHPLSLNFIGVWCRPSKKGVSIEATVIADGKTGVEMEALTAVTVAALTIYDMCKAVDREMSVTRIRLVEKTGGRSGHFKRTMGESGD